MKSRVNFNFFTLAASALVFLILGVCSLILMNSSAQELTAIKQDIDSTVNNIGPDGIGDVEGYGIIANSLIYGLGSFSLIFAEFLLADAPIFCGIVILALAVITRICIKTAAYRILTVIAYVFTLLVTLSYCLIAISIFDSLIVSLLAVIFFIYTIFITAAGFRNVFKRK